MFLTRLRKLLRFLIAGILTCCGWPSFAQGGMDYGEGIKLQLDNDSSKYVRFLFWNQIWFKAGSQNPGTMINGEPRSTSWDIGARRIRFLAYAQISPRYLIVTHFGINNQTFATGGGSGTGPNGAGKKPQLFFHDAYNEFAVKPAIDPKTGKRNDFSLYLGAGLHYWVGISRMTSASTLNFLTIDGPIFNWPLIEVSDQFVRQLGIYTKGKLGKLNYSFSLNKPFATNLVPTFDSIKQQQVAVDNNRDAGPGIHGYLDYQFLDQESNLLPYRVGTYLGTRRVFNIGAGFYHNANGTKSVDAAGQSYNHDINLLGIDLFADLPVGNRARQMAITAYSVFYHYNFGPNYWRAGGVMNTASGFDPAFPAALRPINGPGNARILMGTGNIFYLQAGLLLPKSGHGKWRMQPFAAYSNKQLNYLDDTGHYFDFGFNFLIDGHHSKITPQYSTRPLYFVENGRYIKNGSKGEFLVQFQIYL